MSDDFHEIPFDRELNVPEALSLPRAGQLLNAVQRHRDFSLVKLHQHGPLDDVDAECLVIDVECNGVPPTNAKGINFRERLALIVRKNPDTLVEVQALRRGFPTLIHQYQAEPGGPASLCLYFEPIGAVLRTWTPEAFLRRIQWWLEQSARDELHPADQPVEQLFFTSNNELILPWNFSELRNDPTLDFAVFLINERSDGGITGLLCPISKNNNDRKKVKHIELSLPPIVHGNVERDPITLGQLADMLTGRDVDIIDTMRDALKDGINEKGVIASPEDKGTVIILRIPLCRHPDAAPDRVVYRAFLLPVSALELGVACDALFFDGSRYFRYHLFGKQARKTVWRDQRLLPMSVLWLNSQSAARQQSGIAIEGPHGVLVGAGSLGSALLNLWSRSGWGGWTVIDNDHIKPHNLSRHVASFEHLGQNKALVVQSLHSAAMCNASQFTAIEGDACDFENTDFFNALACAELVIDASTTLEYPRATSTRDNLPRHFSVFVAPNGNSAVMLAEDTNRVHRLRTLEAQYYRAIIREEWGEAHLDGHNGTFWSGASCRDISLIMPYSRILGQASTLAEQIQNAATSEYALIRVWQRTPQCGSVKVHTIPVREERELRFGTLSLYIDAGVEQELRSLRQQHLPNETGGILLGYYDFNINAVVIVAGLPAPADSRASSDSFERGIAGLADVVQEAYKRTAGIVNYVGEWHSHPPGHCASPSAMDLQQLAYLALSMAEEGLPALQLIIGENDLRVIGGTVE